MLHLSDAPTAPGTLLLARKLVRRERFVDAWDCIPEMVISTEPVGHRRDEWAGVLNIPGKFSVLSKVGRSSDGNTQNRVNRSTTSRLAIPPKPIARKIESVSCPMDPDLPKHPCAGKITVWSLVDGTE